MNYRELLTAFAGRLGLPELSFDEEGAVRIAADDMSIAFMELPEEGKLVIWGEVATLPPGNLERLYGAMMDAMFMGRATHGATFAREGDAIYLQRTDSLADLDPERLARIVEDFLNTLEAWRKLVGDYRPDESAEPELAAPSFGTSGFMQV